LLDRQLVEYAFSLPPERLFAPDATKVALREAAEPWVPETVRSRPKSGFSPPFKRWIRGELRETSLRILERSLLAADGVIDPAAVRALVEGGAQRRYGKLWLLLNLEAWYARWVRGRRVSPPVEAPPDAVPEVEARREAAAGALMSSF
jgi:asparagine synthase (glutamine-hydrolysing)